MTEAPPRRRALLLGCGAFVDPSLASLRSPRRDVEEFGRVLADPETGRYTVATDVDCTSRQAQRGIEGFFSAARVSDGMNMLYLSCHGVQDAQGRLYFAFADTERDFLSSTAVSADWVRDRIYASRSKATVVLVDCCFSGAFIKGMRARSAAAANVESLVRDLPDGSGVAVLTASGDTEASFEDADSPEIRPSYFTDALITGIATGAADLNRDGRITVDELYDYTYHQILNGPSSQRPRRLGVGEGALVVSDAAHPQPAPAPVIPPFPAPPRPELSPPAPLAARGVLGWVSFDGQWIVIGKEGVGYIYKGQRRYHISQLSGLAVKPATRLHHGYFQVILTGLTPAPVVRFGPNAGRPPLTDDNSISFARNTNDDFRRFQETVQEAINAAHGRAQPAAPTTPPADATPPSNPPHHPSQRLAQPCNDPPRLLPGPDTGTGRPQPDQQPSAPPDRPGRHHRHSDARPADPTDHDQGAHDGAQAASRLPLAALDGLLIHQFDVVRWLGPWREYWSRTAGQPQPSAARLPSWLPYLAQYLGRHAAPPGSTSSSFTPSPTYLAGFCLGLSKAWSNAVRAGLLPADRPTL
jgi:hypothetical protein